MFTYKIDNDITLALPNPQTDAQALFKLIDDSRHELEVWLPWVQNIQTVADERQSLLRGQEKFRNLASINLLIIYHKTIAGAIGFNNFDMANGKAEIGYWLGSKFVGQGIMHRALAGMCTLGFTKYKVHKLEIYAAVENQRSNQTAHQAGFHLDKTLPNNAVLADGLHAENVWSLHKNDWEKNRTNLS